MSGVDSGVLVSLVNTGGTSLMVAPRVPKEPQLCLPPVLDRSTVINGSTSRGVSRGHDGGVKMGWILWSHLT